MVNRDEPRHRCSLQLSPYIKPEHIRSDDPWRDLCRQATGAVVHGHTTVLQKWDIFRGNFACPESA